LSKEEQGNLSTTHALSLGLTLVTVKAKEFARVPGLQVSNWAEETTLWFLYS
jgi:hypothetical protein